MFAADNYLPVAIIVEGVVAGVGQVNAETSSNRVENLHSCIHPDLDMKLVKVTFY